jgi:membrane associated rhomboid family serine protease
MALLVGNTTSTAPMTTVIIAMTCLSFCAQLQYPWLTMAWVHDVDLIRRGQEHFRYLTAVVLHADTDHLFGNMFSLWGMGTTVERVLGPLSYSCLYVVSGLAGSLLSQHVGTYRRVLGASGAVTGVLGALAVIHIRFAKITTDTTEWMEIFK